ncbi:TlpA family protein disulfide reductase [Zavarzinella formosa]|uniref:TlpA family protein disulfide reductase n=1 Tax=Zavarzinella formosa TaxID=360055 RepID=UPI000300FF45|nr:hypothetical protein [Zavarzinella formosa]
MYAQTLLLTSLLIGAPPLEITSPRMEKGLEVRWVGQFTEASFVPGVRTVRAYDVDTRMLVLSVDEHGTDVALFTRVFLKPTGKGIEERAGAVRMELARVDRKGHALAVPSPADPDNPEPKAKPWPVVQLQGLPYHEAGIFLELPEGKAKTGDIWTREEANRPPITWKVGDLESHQGHIGLKITAKQMTAGFTKTAVRQPEWQRKETLCILPSLGFASKLERVIERREPDIDDLAFRSVLTLEQKEKSVYRGRLFEERREEAITAAAHTAMLDRLLADGGRGGPKSFEALVRRIDGYQTDHLGGDSPYREATQAVRKRAMSAAKGNLPPVQVTGDELGSSPAKEEDNGPLAIGKPTPDISAEMLTAEAVTKLSKLKGRPVLLVYFQPTSTSAAALLKFAQSLHTRHRGRGAVMPLVIGDTTAWKTAYTAGEMTVPIYDGNPVYKTHGLESTPVFVVVDAEGITRHVSRGWGGETAEQVTKEFERWSK